MNDCEFHEQCDRCVGAKLTKEKLKKCMYCGIKKQCLIDEFDANCCNGCADKIGNKLEDMKEQIANEGRCPKCINTNNKTNCLDKRCTNYVSELFTGRMPFELRTYLNAKLSENNDELLRSHVKSIMIIAEAIYKQGVKDGEGYESMSRAISENKCH